MSKARLVLTALLTEPLTVTEIAARHGVHRSWAYRLKARYEAEGDAALEHHHATVVSRSTINRILARHDARTPEPSKRP